MVVEGHVGVVPHDTTGARRIDWRTNDTGNHFGPDLVTALAASNHTIVCGTDGGTVYRYDARRLDEPVAKITLGLEPVLSVSVSQCCWGVATLAGNLEDIGTMGRVCVLSLHDDTLQLQRRPVVPIRHGNPTVGVVKIRHDGRLFGVGGADRRIRLYDRSCRPLAVLRSHEGTVQALDLGQNGMLASGGSDGRIYLWQCFA